MTMGFGQRNQKGDKKESKKVDELGKGKKSPVPRHTQKAEPKKAKPEAPVSGKLSSREAERSLWAPRVSPKAQKKAK
jgi:hypothetical protein